MVLKGFEHRKCQRATPAYKSSIYKVQFKTLAIYLLSASRNVTLLQVYRSHTIKISVVFEINNVF